MATSDGLDIWLNQEANLNVHVHSFEKEFSNGYYLGKILFNFGMLPAFLDYFQNKPQAVYRNTHFDLLIEPMAKLGIRFDENLQKSLKTEELGAAKKLLFKLRSELSKNKDAINFENKSGMSEAQWNLHQRTRRMGMPEKTSKVESHLLRFEEEFLKQKDQAKQKKEQDEARYKESVKRFQEERREHIKLNHDYMERWGKELTTLHNHSKKVQKELIDSHVRFNGMMTESIRRAEDNRSKYFRDDFENGIKEFEDNANRLGVELERDPDRTDKVEKAPFNLVAMMQKVKAKSELNEISRKQKESRARYLKLKQTRLAEELSKQQDEKSRIESHIKASDHHISQGLNHLISEDQEHFIAAQRERQYLERKAKNSSKMEDIVKGLKTMTDEEYKKKNKEAVFNKQVVMFKERKKEYDRHYHHCKGVVETLIEMTDVCFQKLEADEKAGNKSGQLEFEFFKSLQKKFVNQQTLHEEPPDQVELKSTLLTYTKMKGKDDIIDVTKCLSDFLDFKSSLAVPMTYGVFMPKFRDKDASLDSGMGKLMIHLCDTAFPMKPQNQFPLENYNMIPLRLSIMGDTLAGKKTLAKKISATFHIPIISLTKLFEKAKGFVKQEEKHDEEGEAEASKAAAGGKKKPAEKPPVKGPGGKKVEPPPLTEAELEFQRIGIKLKNLEAAKYPVPDDLKCELIFLELKQSIPERKYSDVKTAYLEAKTRAEEQKKVKAAKTTPAQETGKKTDKSKADKAGLAGGHSPNAASKDSLVPVEEALEYTHPYTRGFILMDYPSTVEEAE